MKKALLVLTSALLMLPAMMFAHPAIMAKVAVDEQDSCHRPSSIKITGTNTSSITLAWTETGTATSWNVAHGPSGFAIDSTTAVDVVNGTASFTIGNLASNVAYDFYVQSNCGDGLSEWEGPFTAIPGKYNMSTTGLDTLTTCSAVIYDDGGPTGNYSDYCSSLLVLYPETPGALMSISGTILAENSNYDYICVFDGVGVANQLYKTNQSSNQTLNFGPVVSTSGPLTILFHSDASTNKAGFEIHTDCYTCVTPVIQYSSLGLNEASLNWSDNYGLSSAWQIAYGPHGFDLSTATPYDLDTNSYRLNNLTSNTAYDVYIRTNCGDGTYSDWSAVFEFRTMANPPAITPYFCDFENAEENSAWTFVNENQTNKWYIGKPSGYADSVLFVSGDLGASAAYNYSAASHVCAYRDIAFGTGEDFSLRFKWQSRGENAYDYLRVFIGDPTSVYDNNNIPANAVQISSDLCMHASWQYFDVPLGASYSNTVKRLYFVWQNDNSYGLPPAAVLDSIQILVSECARPTNVTVTGILSDGFDVTFEPASPTDMGWEYVVCESDSNPDTQIATAIADTFFSVTGLIPFTDYNIYVRTTCGMGRYSAWSIAVPVTTNCLPVATLPYIETFDSCNTVGNTVPDCWLKINTYYLSRPSFSHDEYYSGPYSLLFYAGPPNTFNMAITPEFSTAIHINTLKATFMYRADTLADDLVVGVISNPLDASTFIPVDTIRPSESHTWLEKEVLFDNYTGSGRYIAFKNYYHGTNADKVSYIDDLVIDFIPTCDKPMNVAVDVTTTTAEVHWTEAGSATRWNIEYKSVADTAWNNIIPVDTTSYIFSDLTPNTQYQIRVQAACDTDFFSDWTDTVTFILAEEIPDPCWAPSDLAVSDIHNHDVTLSWTENGTATRWIICYRVHEDETSEWSTQTVATNPYTLTGLDAETSYDVYVQADCGDGDVSDTIMVSFTTETEPCSAPTNVTVENFTTLKAGVNVHWAQEPNTASSWDVLYKMSTESSWTTVTTTDTFCYLQNLEPLTEYDLKVWAHCGEGVTSEASEEVHFTTASDGIEDYDAAAVTLFPNPTTGMVQVSSSKFQVSSVEVYDVYGKLLKTEDMIDNNTVDMSGCASGVYFFKVSTENGVVTKRIVKK
ncbi:MAG: fibronectin type III domain-containing protein [Bacteroidales bacterium]|nr:fibronectin type III domain-containing protein [Bacteroidales bacterium]